MFYLKLMATNERIITDTPIFIDLQYYNSIWVKLHELDIGICSLNNVTMMNCLPQHSNFPVQPFQPSVTFYTENSHLFSCASQMTSSFEKKRGPVISPTPNLSFKIKLCVIFIKGGRFRKSDPLFRLGSISVLSTIYGGANLRNSQRLQAVIYLFQKIFIIDIWNGRKNDLLR